MVEPGLHDQMASTEEKLEQRDHRGWTGETTHVTLTKETGNDILDSKITRVKQPI
jgi:hypothetical protein